MVSRIAIIAASGAIFLISAAALAQTPPPGPACQRMEAQLAALDRGNDDPARADQIRRAEDSVNRQQYEVDRLVAQGRRMGCERSGFFSIFSNPPAQCGPLNRQIDQMRNALERMQNQLQQLQGGTMERAEQRRSLLIALANQGCGPQYRSAALSAQQGGFFDRLFGTTPPGTGPAVGPDGGQTQSGNTFRTLCVRTCDGYYYPISFATTPDRFRIDEQTCQRTCPAAEVSLYTYHNPGEDMQQAVSLNGQPYTALPTAFQYRKQLNPACSCRKAGESWYDALKGLSDNTIQRGDIVVNAESAKRMSQPRDANGRPIKPAANAAAAATAPSSSPAPSATAGEEPGKRKVRIVGPTFIPSH
ncbi:MAG TPA: DUF2865 domain-containing protein [Pseudolabrys sp.]|nr:DUF2865 domain-containing protein [Pseudolabrys sp.]